MSDGMIRPLPTSPEEWRAWRRVDRAKVAMIAVTMVTAIMTLVLVVTLLSKGNATIQAVRDTQTEGSPFLRAIAGQQDELQHSADNSQAILDQLNDCLQPTGSCYKKSQQRSSALLSLVLVGVSCAAGYIDLSDAERIEATNECVSDWLSRHPELSLR